MNDSLKHFFFFYAPDNAGRRGLYVCDMCVPLLLIIIAYCTFIILYKSKTLSDNSGKQNDIINILTWIC